MCQEQVSGARERNYNPQYQWHVIVCPYPSYLLLAQQSWNFRMFKLLSCDVAWHGETYLIKCHHQKQTNKPKSTQLEIQCTESYSLNLHNPWLSKCQNCTQSYLTMMHGSHIIAETHTLFREKAEQITNLNINLSYNIRSSPWLYLVILL